MTGTDLCVRLYKSVPVIFETPYITVTVNSRRYSCIFSSYSVMIQQLQCYDHECSLFHFGAMCTSPCLKLPMLYCQLKLPMLYCQFSAQF